MTKTYIVRGWRITPSQRDEIEQAHRNASFLCYPPGDSPYYIFGEIVAAYDNHDAIRITSALTAIDLEISGAYYKTFLEPLSEPLTTLHPATYIVVKELST